MGARKVTPRRSLPRGGKVIAPGCTYGSVPRSWPGARRSQADAKNNGTKVHFASFIDLGHLKNSELEPQYQKNKGGVVLRGDTVKDDSGAFAVFTEQGSSASQMTAANVMDIISRQPGCAGQAADAAYAYTR